MASRRLSTSVSTGHEERCHRRHPTRVASRGVVILQPTQVCVHNLSVSLQREDQGDVDRDPLGEKAADRRDAFRRRRDLDQQVGPVDLLDPVPGLGHARLGFTGEGRRHFHGDKAIVPWVLSKTPISSSQARFRSVAIKVLAISSVETSADFSSESRSS